ncbi:MAG: metallophosphatase family protein [Actinomycetota bacterium]|nr:metallophosphatase family protein [Actinomycetota bacterium]
MTAARRVAALYDLHGNLPALEAVLAEIAREDVDLVVFGGDLAWGPRPRETVERALDPGLPARYVRGNGDRSVGERQGTAQGLEPWVAEVTEWCADRLGPRLRASLLEMEPSVTVSVEGVGSVLFCHGSPRSDEEILTDATPDARLSEAVAGVTADLVVCGHTHMQFDRASGDVRVVNAGSVGMPYEAEPGAYWALLGPGVSLRRTAYDYASAAAAVEASGCPYALEFAKDVVTPPSRAEATAQFEGGGVGE